jgi:hypothetical protein
MTKYFLRITGLALLWSVPFLGQAPTAATADDAMCCKCCPHCGCRLVPVCHICCDTKKVTEYKYSCTCDEICIPGVTPLCHHCEEGCGGRCAIHESRKLVKYPVTKEVPVRKCTVEWTCPQCGHQGNGAEDASPSAPPTPPSAPAPPAPPAAGKSAANSLPDHSAGTATTSGLHS